jgi:hypothetical protein
MSTIKKTATNGADTFTRKQLNGILPAIIAALSGQRGLDGGTMKVAFAPNGHIEAIVTLLDDGPVVSFQSETASPPDDESSAEFIGPAPF